MPWFPSVSILVYAIHLAQSLSLSSYVDLAATAVTVHARRNGLSGRIAALGELGRLNGGRSLGIRSIRCRVARVTGGLGK